MKTILQSFSVFLIIMMAFQSQAAATFPVYKIINAGQKTFVLSFEKDTAIDAELRIEDETGIILLQEQIGSTSPPSKKYNLEQLPIGSYVLIIEDGLKIETQNIHVKSNTLFIDMASKQVEYKPVYELEDHKLKLNVLQLNRPAAIVISDADGHELLTEDIVAAETFNKVYNLQALPNGRYVIRVSIGETQHYHSFVID